MGSDWQMCRLGSRVTPATVDVVMASWVGDIGFGISEDEAFYEQDIVQ